MSGYTKLFSSILASTVWREDDKTRIVWITLLAMTDRFGIAEGSVPGLADFARVSIEDCERALKRLSSPDKHSRSKVKDGRRIEDVPGGWRIINHGPYRDKMTADERREYFKLKKRQYRKRASNPSPQESTNVQDCPAPSRMSTHTDPDPAPDSDPKEKERRAEPRKKPRFSGQRLTVFDWQYDELNGYLNGTAEAFNLDGWFRVLDAEMLASGTVSPKRDSGAFLQSAFLTECQKRGIMLSLGAPAAVKPEKPRDWTCNHDTPCATKADCKRRGPAYYSRSKL